MKFQATVDAARLEQPMELGGRRGEVGDYLVAGEGPGFVFLKAATFEMIFRPVNGGAPAKAARRPYTRSQPKGCATEEAADEPGRKVGDIGRLILQALKDGPKVVSAVTEWMRAHGLPEYTHRQAGLSLGYQARQDRVQRGKNRVWRLKE